MSSPMQFLILSTFIATLIAGCAATPMNYEVSGQRVQGERRGAQLIAEEGNAAVAIQTSDADQSPRLVRSVAPVMPREAIARGIEGEVRVELSIDSQGNVSEVKVLKSPDALLSEAVITAMKRWVFIPMIKGGRPQGFQARQTYTFRLDP